MNSGMKPLDRLGVGRLLMQEPHRLLARAPRNHLLQADERAAADEEDVGRVDGSEFLVGMLATTLRRHVGDGAFEDLEQSLLHAFAGYVARNRRVLVLAADLVDFVDVDNPLLAALNVPVGGLQQLEDDVLHVLANVAGFGEGGGVDNRERHVQNLRQRLRHQRLACAGGPDEEDVGLLQLHFTVAHPVHLDSLAVIVDGDGELLLGGLLPDDILVKKFFDLERLRDLVGNSGRGLDFVVLQNGIADGDALVADVRTRVIARRRDELSDYVLTFMAKRTS
jgi:hypothetical protein